ncbi:ATP-binding cassette, subfamily B [Anaerovirgula multivorans]|uniref:ATP-binding cassette, subfamily B n=1 Tax=Anaerovirgula multivorans TaxID=312168 RepID=A0A239K037_9FIRM|nr:ABC transporter ATP-binding protein [Anaerovirgula multivorans]SNT11023.1 ATP-binding cassette, subfamily B [Anaerovirgula multivorans]
MNKENQNHHFLKSAMKTVFKHRPMFFLLLFGTVGIGAIANVWPSLILRQIVDGPLTTGEGAIWKMAFTYLAAVLVIGILDFIREISATVIGQGVLLDIRKQMLEHLQKLPMKYYLRVPVGETLSKFTADLDAVNTLFSAGLVSAMADILKILGIFVALFALSKPTGWIALGALPIIFFLSNFFRKNIFVKQKEVRKKVSDINTTIQEVYSGLKIVKTFGKEDLFSKRFEEKLEAHRLAMNGNSIYDAWFPCIMQIVRASVIALALVVGASNNGTTFALGLSIGTLAAIADLFVRMFEPVEAIASEIQTIQQAFAGIDRVKGFFSEIVEDKHSDETENVIHMDPTVKSDIILNHVVFEYTDGKKVINKATFTIKEGSKVAIAGRTGSGKTTILSLIAGLYPATSGTITIGGANPFLLPASERRKYMGIVPQNVQLFNGSILDNITLKDTDITREDAWIALETVRLGETVRELEKGIDTVIGEGEVQLSFGQMQLLSLARAIVINPPILLLDELTSGLDALTEKVLLNAIRQVSSNRTIITISHRISGIIDADTVHIMDAGKVVESGTPEELSKMDGWFAIYKRLEERGWKVG